MLHFDVSLTGASQHTDVFTVAVNGTVVTKVMLSYELQTEYLVCVRIRQPDDVARLRKRDVVPTELVDRDVTGYVSVVIEDINDNGPVFFLRNITACAFGSCVCITGLVCCVYLVCYDVCTFCVYGPCVMCTWSLYRV